MNSGINFESYREPGSTPLGEAIRELLLKPSDSSGNINNNSEFLMFATARSELMEKKVIPALQQGSIVLLNRHIDSSTAYQGYGRGVDFDLITSVNRIVTHGIIPDLTLLLDLNVDEAMQRIGKSIDRIEGEGADFLNRVRRGYLKIAEREPERCRIIDASMDIDEVADRVINEVGKIIRLKQK